MLVCEGDSQYMARTTTLTPEERAEKRKEYQREYTKKRRAEGTAWDSDKTKKNEAQKKWVKNNPEKVKKYVKENLISITSQISKLTDPDMYGYLKGIDNISAYLKRLIQEDMNRNKPEK
jgi:hypothetical protein